MNTQIQKMVVGGGSLVLGVLVGHYVWTAPMSGSHTMNMQDSMSNMTAGLEGKKGDAFDQAFLSEMIVHHEGAIDMAELVLKHAKHDELKTMAHDIIDAQSREVAQMKAWQETWYQPLH
jgi:uncharacterized protein (DUF305 family)